MTTECILQHSASHPEVLTTRLCFKSLRTSQAATISEECLGKVMPQRWKKQTTAEDLKNKLLGWSGQWLRLQNKGKHGRQYIRQQAKRWKKRHRSYTDVVILTFLVPVHALLLVHLLLYLLLFFSLFSFYNYNTYSINQYWDSSYSEDRKSVSLTLQADLSRGDWQMDRKWPIKRGAVMQRRTECSRGSAQWHCSAASLRTWRVAS